MLYFIVCIYSWLIIVFPFQYDRSLLFVFAFFIRLDWLLYFTFALFAKGTKILAQFVTWLTKSLLGNQEVSESCPREFIYFDPSFLCACNDWLWYQCIKFISRFCSQYCVDSCKRSTIYVVVLSAGLFSCRLYRSWQRRLLFYPGIELVLHSAFWHSIMYLIDVVSSTPV